MAEVWPFAGTRYAASERKLEVGKLVCPPYDEITPALQGELHEREPHNFVRLVFGKEAASDDDTNNRYSRAAECYRDWKARGILADEQRKCFYLYEQVFKVEGRDEPVSRVGFFALVKLQDFRSGNIRSFEMTFDSPKLDRLKLLRTTQVNLCPIHALFRDEANEIGSVLRDSMGSKEIVEEFTDETGMIHRVWMMHRKDPILRIHEAMKPQRLYIADGHHRYETALKYRDEMREMTSRRDGRQPYDFVLMFLQRAEDDSLFAEPVHRVLARELGIDVDIDEVVEDLEQFFHVSEFKLNMKDPEKAAHTVQEKLRPTRTAKTRYVMALPSGRAWQLSLNKDADLSEMIEEETMTPELKSMDVVLLHQYVIARGWIGNPEVTLGEDDVFYRRDIGEAISLLQKRKGCVAFFLNGASKEDVLRVAENGELLPHHSVNFFPKVPSGLVMRDHNVGFG